MQPNMDGIFIQKNKNQHKMLWFMGYFLI